MTEKEFFRDAKKESLVDYVKNHAIPNENGSVDMYFFKVNAVNQPDVQTFIRLTKEHQGEFNEVDPFDGREHNFIELGGWLGDQEKALLYMALGKILGLWNVIQPKMFVDKNKHNWKQIASQMAGMGMVAIVPLPNNSTLKE